MSFLKFIKSRILFFNNKDLSTSCAEVYFSTFVLIYWFYFLSVLFFTIKVKMVRTFAPIPRFCSHSHSQLFARNVTQMQIYCILGNSKTFGHSTHGIF